MREQLRVMCTFMGARKASTKRFENLKMRSIPRAVRVKSGFVYSRSALVNEHREEKVAL